LFLIVESPSRGIRLKSQTGNRKVVFEAIFHTSDIPNRNGRVYPLEVMKQAVSSIKPRLKEKTFGGELDHPLPSSDEYGSSIRHITLKFKEMSHAITDLWFEGKTLVGRAETLDTPNGQILCNLIKDGVQVGFSIRAIAENLRNDGKYDVVEPPISLIAVDAVSVPSHDDAKIQRVRSIEQSIVTEADPETVKILENHFNLRQYFKAESLFKTYTVYDF